MEHSEFTDILVTKRVDIKDLIKKDVLFGFSIPEHITIFISNPKLRTELIKYFIFRNSEYAMPIDHYYNNEIVLNKHTFNDTITDSVLFSRIFTEVIDDLGIYKKINDEFVKRLEELFNKANGELVERFEELEEHSYIDDDDY